MRGNIFVLRSNIVTSTSEMLRHSFDILHNYTVCEAMSSIQTLYPSYSIAFFSCIGERRTMMLSTVETTTITIQLLLPRNT